MNTQEMIFRFALCLLGSILLAPSVAAQTFDTVINVPPSPDIVSNFANPASVGGDGLNTQLNFFDGGSVGTQFDANSGSEVNISGGSVGSFFNANSGSVVNISGGNVGIGFDANSGSEVNISGGSVGDFFEANLGSVVNISGGNIGTGFDAGLGSEINISGGVFGGTFSANAGVVDDSVVPFVITGSEINLFGTDFVLGNQPLDDSLTLGTAFTILDRDVPISGLLADGSAFSFDLNSVDSLGEDFFNSNANLTVTLVSAVPEPGSLTLLGLAGVFLLVQRRKTSG